MAIHGYKPEFYEVSGFMVIGSPLLGFLASLGVTPILSPLGENICSKCYGCSYGFVISGLTEERREAIEKYSDTSPKVTFNNRKR